MELKSGYKQTEAGVVPEDWNLMPFIQAVGSYIDYRGRTPRKLGLSWGGGDILALSANNVQMGRIDPEKEAYFGSEELYRKWMIQGECEEGDVLLTMEAPLGNVAQIPDRKRYILSQRVLLIKPKDWLLRDYFAHYMKGMFFQKQLSLNATGSTAKGIQRRKLDELYIYLPPTKAEQEAIAEALSDTDVLIESLEQLITKKRQIKQGAMQELLTGKRRLPGFSGEWVEISLLELALGKKELFDDGDWIEAEHITSEGIRLIQTGNIGIGQYVETDVKKYIFESSFTTLRCKEVKEGDLLICRLADPAGRACVLPNIGESKIITSVDVTIFRPPSSTTNRVFLANLFSTNNWFRAVSGRSGGTTHKRISRGALGQLTVKVPQLTEQTAIAEILSDMDTEIAALEAKLAKARHIKQGMMQELLTGRIRLL